MNWRTFAGSSLLTAGVWMFGMPAVGDEPAATKLARDIQVTFSEPGSLEDALHVRKAAGAVGLTRHVKETTLRIDLYRNGQKVKTLATTLSLSPDQEAADASFSVQLIDLDFLRLGDGKPGHFRVVSTVKLGNQLAGTTQDVPKDVFFGTGHSAGSQPYQPHAGTTTEVPLFHMIVETRPDANGHSTQYGAGTVEEVVRKNKTADVLVATLVCDPPPGETPR